MVSFELPTIKNATEINITIGLDGAIYEYQFNLGELLVDLRSIVEHIEGDVRHMPTHEDITKRLRKAMGYA
jgi:hypothetical protein